MFRLIHEALKLDKGSTRNIRIAKGLYKYPSNWNDIKRHLKLKYING